MQVTQHQAKAVGRDLSISTKHAVEVSSFIRGRTLKKSRELLLQVMEKKVAVPFKRFNMDVYDLATCDGNPSELDTTIGSYTCLVVR